MSSCLTAYQHNIGHSLSRVNTNNMTYVLIRSGKIVGKIIIIIINEFRLT